MKKSCTDSPALALGLVRLGVGLLFLIPGLMKLLMMGPDNFISIMIQGQLGIPGMVGVITGWLVIIGEIGGGLAILLGNKVPQALYKFSVAIMALITLVSMVMVHWANPQSSNWIMDVLFHLLALLALIGLFCSRPLCPCGFTGACDRK